MLREWYGSGKGVARELYGSGMGMVWEWYESGGGRAPASPLPAAPRRRPSIVATGQKAGKWEELDLAGLVSRANCA